MLVLSRNARADTAADLARFSVFPEVDLQKLGGGKVMVARGPAMSFPRDLAVEALYVVPAPLSKAFELHKQWEPTRHPELKVYLHGELGPKPSTADFERIASAPNNGAVKAMVAATAKLPARSELQLNSGEAQQFAPDGSRGSGMPKNVVNFWTQLLGRRALAFVQKGLTGQPAYEFDGKSVTVAEEASRLLKGQPKVRAQFQSFLEQTPLGGGAGSVPASLYWELFDVDGQAAFVLGSSYGRVATDTAQIIDLQYYSSGGFLVFITLYQMWPVTFEGQSATLVWRGDMLSSLSLAELHGVERLGSGAAMMKEVQKNVASFLRDAGR